MEAIPTEKESIMAADILICGLNGAGKSTLGRALADKLNFFYIDSEDLYFTANGSITDYTAPRTEKEAAVILRELLEMHPNFVLTAVTGSYGMELDRRLTLVVRMIAPR